MATNSKAAYGATGVSNLLYFDPEDVHLVTDVKHPLYDPRVKLPVDPMTVASIMLKGVVEPIIVWKDPDTGKVLVVDGRGRTQACREANKQLKKRGEAPKSLPAIVGKGDASGVMGTMVVANEGRREVTAISRAHRAKRLLAQGYTDDEVATLLHVSRSSMRNLMLLLDAPTAVQEAVASGEVPVTMGYAMAKLPAAEAKEKIETMREAVKDEPAPEPGGKVSRKRTKKMREAFGVRAVTMRRPAIEAKIEEIGCLKSAHREAYTAALRWVLGERKELP